MPRTPAGRRDTRVEFLAAAAVRSALGGKVASDADYASQGSRLAKVLFGTGTERRAAAVEEATQAATFRFLLDSLTRQVTAEWRLRCKGLDYDVTGFAAVDGEIEITGVTRRG